MNASQRFSECLHFNFVMCQKKNKYLLDDTFDSFITNRNKQIHFFLSNHRP